MAKVTFSKLNLKVNTDVKVINIGDVEIEVKKYLPVEEKNSLIQLVAQNSIEFNFINPLVAEKLLHLYFIYKYTNLSFTAKQREDEDALYDILESNGIVDAVVQASYDEYAYLVEKCGEFMENLQRQQNSLYGIVSKILNDVPETLAEVISLVDDLDTEKIGQAVKYVKDNGGNSDAINEVLFGQS